MISNGGSSYSFRELYPGITVLNGSDPLMQGVTVPSTPGEFDVGRTAGNTFVAGATQVATWADGTAMIGYKSVGSGEVIGINLHVITGDCAYEVINQPWATQIFLNAVECAPPIPEPLTLFATMAGLGAVAAYLRKRLRA